jgi:hypothetical protein
LFDNLKRWAPELKAQLLSPWLCRIHPDTPLLAMILAAQTSILGWVIWTGDMRKRVEYPLSICVKGGSGSVAPVRRFWMQTFAEFFIG